MQWSPADLSAVARKGEGGKDGFVIARRSLATTRQSRRSKDCGRKPFAGLATKVVVWGLATKVVNRLVKDFRPQSLRPRTFVHSPDGVVGSTKPIKTNPLDKIIKTSYDIVSVLFSCFSVFLFVLFRTKKIMRRMVSLIEGGCHGQSAVVFQAVVGSVSGGCC
jgi:hypothetical protein